MLDWLSENKEWLFSGGGVVLLGWIFRKTFNKKNTNDKQHIESGDNSTNYQSTGDINITERNVDNER